MKRGFLNKPNKPVCTTNTTEVAAGIGKLTEPLKLVNDDTIPSGTFHVNLEDNTLRAGNATSLNLQNSASNPYASVFDYMNSTTHERKTTVITKFSHRTPSLPNEPITAAMLYGGTEKALYSRPGFFKTPFRSPPPLSSEWPFVIKDVPGMGKGVFARKDIPLGKLIVHERLILITPAAMCVPAQSVEGLDQFVETLVNQLDDETRMEFYRLHNCKDASVSQTLGIIRTNSLGIGELPGPYKGSHGGLGLAICRLNHSCSPNATWTFDLDTLSVRISACQTIKKDEQIFISYTSVFGSRLERQSELLKKYSFTCMCTSCSLSKNESARSDIRRGLLDVASKQPFENLNRTTPGQYLRETIAKWALSPSLPDDHITKPSLRVLAMFDEEKLTGSRPAIEMFHAFILCTAFCALRDRASVVKWAKKGLAFAEAGLGMGDQAGLGMWRDFVNNPEGSEYWGLRSRRVR